MSIGRLEIPEEIARILLFEHLLGESDDGIRDFVMRVHRYPKLFEITKLRQFSRDIKPAILTDAREECFNAASAQRNRLFDACDCPATSWIFSRTHSITLR